MKFNLNHNDKLKLRALLERANWNIDFSEFINEEILNGSAMFNSPLFSFAKSLKEGEERKLDKSAIEDYSSEMEPHLPYLKHDNPSNYLNETLSNIYYNLSLIRGDYELTSIEMPPYTPFLLEETISSKESDFCEVNRIGFFTSDFSYPLLSYKGNVWMSLLPFEINTAKKAIEEIKGKVLIYGLGLGYVPISLALKESVSKIVVIENDPHIISIFKEAIYPNVPFKEKLEIIQADAYSYQAKESFDYTYIDIYRNEEDGLLAYKKLLVKASKNTIFWINESIITYLRRIILELIREELEEFDYIEDDPTELGKLILELKEKLKDHEFNSYLEVEDFLSSNNLKSFIA